MPNRLADETSPYLLQHAHNPVDWLPWGEEARRRARETDRPILLSIGYSSCHWCHVMERESFEDEATARLMNEGFVPVKVDREERPDVDAIYMRAVQALTGHGGWPLTVFLTPEGVPFYGGTYFPPEPRHGLPSFAQLLGAIRQAWDERREEVEASAGQIRELLERAQAPGGDGGEPGVADLELAVRRLLGGYDPVHGGFGRAPKFPQPVLLEFLLRRHARGGDAAAGESALHTLRRMAEGGLRDHLAGGFHRYSVDARWLVPHFEKMLYDNALLAGAYLEAWRLSGDEGLSEVTRETLEWMLAEMRTESGGFAAALDADTEGEEGRFYVWAAAEVDRVLGEEDGPLFRKVYGVSESGNWEGTNILHLARAPSAVADDEGLPPAELEERLRGMRERLADAREKRERPFRDEKVLASWNGLAIRVFAEAGAALGEERWVDVARETLEHLLEALRDENGLLRHQLTGTVAAIPAFLDDVASLGHAALSLHEATLEPRWLREAVALAEEAEARFSDPDSGLLVDTPEDGETLIVRPRDVTDNAVPSGTSLAAELFLRLGRTLDRETWRERARRLVGAEREGMARAPAAFGRLLSVADDLASPPVEIAIVGDPSEEATRRLLRETHRGAPPGRVIAGGSPDEVPFSTPLLEGRGRVDGAAAAWVCHGYACRAPITEPDELAEALRA